jgi:hypothetical protein
MRTFETKFHYVFESEEDRGVYQFRINKDLDQIQIEIGVGEDFSEGDEYIDINRIELTAIRDLINKALGEEVKEDK